MRLIKSFSILIVATAFFCLDEFALADGILLYQGRVPDKNVVVFKIEPEQKKLIDMYYKCPKDNTKSPYIFYLNPTQSLELMKSAKIAPKRFAIVDSYHGDKDIELELNVINRFSENEIEIPVKLLVVDNVAANWEKNTIGWKPNPLETITREQLNSGICPK